VTAGEDASQGIRSAVDNSTVKVAQGFQVDTAGPVEFVDVKLIKTGTPTGNIWFTIEADSGGVPTNTPLATSDKLDVSRISTTATIIRIPFRTPVSLSAATQYHLVAQGDWAVSAANFISWRMDGSAAAYANGSKALYDSDTVTWTTDTDDDLWCRIYVTRNETALTKPANYTQSAVIGWVYNDSGSNFFPFRQHDRRWGHHLQNNGLLVNETVVASTLVDLRAFVPPIACVGGFTITGTGAAIAGAALSDLKGTDVNAAAAGAFSVALSTGLTSEFPGSPGDLALEYASIMLSATAGADLYIQGFTW